MYKLNKYVSNAGVSNEYLSILHKTATALGAMVGLNQFVYIIQTIVNLNYDTIAPVLIGRVLIQQCIVAAILVFTRRCVACVKSISRKTDLDSYAYCTERETLFHVLL